MPRLKRKKGQAAEEEKGGLLGVVWVIYVVE